MTEFAKWLLTLVKQFWVDLLTFVTDAFISLLELFLKALLALIQAISMPTFATQGLQSTFNMIPAEVWFFASHLKLTECFAMLGAAFAFRLARKIATLFQW